MASASRTAVWAIAGPNRAIWMLRLPAIARRMHDSSVMGIRDDDFVSGSTNPAGRGAAFETWPGSGGAGGVLVSVAAGGRFGRFVKRPAGAAGLGAGSEASAACLSASRAAIRLPVASTLWVSRGMHPGMTSAAAAMAKSTPRAAPPTRRGHESASVPAGQRGDLGHR